MKRDFSELLWMFNSVRETRDIIRLDLNEAGLLYKWAKLHHPVLKNNVILEIGRYSGGSLVLLAMATHNTEVKIISIDCIEGCHDPDVDDWLNEYDEKHRLDIRVGNSHTMENIQLSMLFVDGDHSYEGCKKDFDHHWNWVDGPILCHDYTDSTCPGVTRCVDEYVENGKAKIIEQAGTMVVLEKLEDI